MHAIFDREGLLDRSRVYRGDGSYLRFLLGHPLADRARAGYGRPRQAPCRLVRRNRHAERLSRFGAIFGRMSAKFIGYFRLVDACAKPGCPVCRCLREDAIRHLRGLLAEHVTDPATRGLIRAARGFCNGHAAMLQDVPDAAFGAAIISADLIAAEGRRARRLIAPRRQKGPLRRFLRGRPGGADGRAACLTCRSVQASEARYLKEMLSSVGEPEFEQALERADGLCRPHLTLLAEHAERGSERALERLVEWNRAKWGQIQRVLERFIEKHDYRRRAPLTEEEAAAWRLALEMLAGAPAYRS